ncbi:hypothetical protein PS645_04175 [Pseudomonas fluorescens]|uniref:Uncharacterized protein n=1 Tax=Pseudomonas fluorescens TaxID=294 RepID=A0A5E6VTV2_PSEFL|nr:hypothetical protein PS645_04175 [Pseudomonas fluorescens]
MTAGMGFALIMSLVILIGGVLAGLSVRGFICLLRQRGEPLARNRGWIAVIACVGCFAWYPLHGTFNAGGAVVSFLFAVGMLTSIVY